MTSAFAGFCGEPRNFRMHYSALGRHLLKFLTAETFLATSGRVGRDELRSTTNGDVSQRLETRTEGVAQRNSHSRRHR
jgi:hypothetical protein